MLGICLSLFSGSAWAEKMYVTDMMEITLRTGPGIDHKIVAMLKSGQEVDFVIEDKEWSMISLPSGRQGWVLSRFISQNPPSRLVLESLKEKHKALTLQAASLLEENMKIKSENQRLSTELTGKQEITQGLTRTYEALKKNCAEYFELKSNYESTVGRLADQTRKAEKLEEELKRMHENRAYIWFLCGAGVIILGFLIGFSVRSQRRRSSLL